MATYGDSSWVRVRRRNGIEKDDDAVLDVLEVFDVFNTVDSFDVFKGSQTSGDGRPSRGLAYATVLA